MPSLWAEVISPKIKTLLGKKMDNDIYNKQNQQLHPQDILKNQAEKWQISLTSEQFARKLDETDPLQHTRNEFYVPKIGTLPHGEFIDAADKSHTDPDKDCIYFCGHSLGLQPKRVRKSIDNWLKDWAELGVRGHVHGTNPFAKCDYPCIPALKTLLGATDNEVAVMNQLSSNIHFMMISFYRPTKERFKILYEDRAFPSDDYAIHSQIRFHGYDPTEAAVLLKPRENETYIRTEDILELLKEQGQSIALVLLSGIQFYTGQFFDIKTITHAAQQQGCVAGWDLAHAVGNVPLQLHDWNVDFAVFCSYKYLNSGAGCVGGIFVHSNHFDKQYPHLDGWWGNRYETRFEMRPEMDRDTGANGFRVSNPSIHQCAVFAASLEIFEEVGIDKLRAKSKLLTQYLQYLIENEINQSSNNLKIQFITPSDPEQRGAQLSLRISGVDGKKLFNELERSGVCSDLRADVIRIAPIPLYNTFMDVYQFVSLLKTIKI
ncbi:unnamed protein product [Adineta steineri]|uniref:Kynureninase n=1 Tax=Adineta steineri TaxID=433720 RepID=A0A813S648_9BILA|nr:unnamed protein product [Adineta steineri]CAF0794663.1 unnamed protein product [Adineta steineri]